MLVCRDGMSDLTMASSRIGLGVALWAGNDSVRSGFSESRFEADTTWGMRGNGSVLLCSICDAGSET